MAKATTNETVFISIERPVKGSLTLRIVGDSPLIVHAWSEKAKKEMLQARQMISAVRIVWEEKSPPVRAYVNVRLVEQDALSAADAMHPTEEPAAKEPPARCYMPLEEVLEQPQLRTQMLEDARRDAQTFRQKYNTLEAIAPIITGIDAVFGEEDAPCAQQ